MRQPSYAFKNKLEGMELKLLFTVAVVIFAGIPAVVLARRIGSGWPSALAISLVLTIGAAVVVGFGIAAGVEEKLWMSGGDTDLSYVFYPFLAAPVYLAIALAARKIMERG